MLRLEAVHSYYEKSHILQGVSLEIAEGETVSLLGRNGVGKSTTMRTIMGLNPPRRGRIFFNEGDVTGVPPYKMATLGIGYVPENRQVFPRLSVMQNLRIGLDLQKLSEGEKQKNLDAVYESFPRLRERADQVGSTLSGGEQQMLALARAIVTQPKLILLDEPTEGLMPAMVNEIEQIIRWMSEDLKIAILLVEQDYRLALRASTRGYIMAKGRIVHSGESADVLADSETLHEHLGVA